MSCMCAYASCKHTHTHVSVWSIGRQHARILAVARVACIFKRSPAPAHDLLQAEPFACWINPFLSRTLRLLFDRFVMGSAARALDSCQRSRGRARAPPHIRCAQQAGDWLEEVVRRDVSNNKMQSPAPAGQTRQGQRGSASGSSSDPSWLVATRSRQMRHRRSAGEAGTERWVRVGEMMAGEEGDEYVPANPSEVREAHETLRSDLSSSLAFHEPQADTMIVEGRPTQVTLAKKHRL